MDARRSSSATAAAASAVSELEDIFEALSNDRAGPFDLEKVLSSGKVKGAVQRGSKEVLRTLITQFPWLSPSATIGARNRHLLKDLLVAGASVGIQHATDVIAALINEAILLVDPTVEGSAKKTAKVRVVLGKATFPDLAAVRARCRQMLKEYDVNELLSDDDQNIMLQLLRYHPRKEVVDAVNVVFVGYNEDHDCRSFFVQWKSDMSAEDFSYVQCVQQFPLPTTEALDLITDCLVEVAGSSVPRVEINMGQLVAKKMPFRMKPLDTLRMYTRFCFKVCKKAKRPHLIHKNILTALFERLCEMDLETQTDSDGDIAFTEAADNPRSEEDMDLMAQRLDALMTECFRFFRDTLSVSGGDAAAGELPSGEDNRLVSYVLGHFEDVVLRTHKTKYVQYLAYYVSSLHIKYAEAFICILLKRLYGETTEDGEEEVPTQEASSPTETRSVSLRNEDKRPHLEGANGSMRDDFRRRLCGEYLGNFCCRATFLPDSYSQQTLKFMLEFIQQQEEPLNFDTCVLIVVVVQSICYMLCWKLQAWASEGGSEFLDGIFDKESHKSLVYTLSVQPKLLDFVAPPLLQQLARTVATVPSAQPLGVLIMEALAHQYASMNRGQPVDGVPPSPDPEASEFNFQNLNWKEFERKVMAQRRSSMPVAPGSINLAQRLQPVYPFEPYNLRHSQGFITEIYRDWSDVPEVEDESVKTAVLEMLPAGALGLPKEKAAEELLTFMWKDPVSSDADDDAASGASDASEISLAGEIEHGGYSSSATDEEITYNPHARVAMPRLRKAGFANTLHPPASADHGSGREGHDRPAIVVTPSPAFHPRHVPDVPRSRRESSLEEPSPKRQRLTSVDEDELYDSSIPLLPPATLVAGDSSTNHWDEPDYDDDEFEMEDTLANRVLLSVMGSRAFRSS
ncbi:DNA independent RNA polymerase I transcription factor [Perkinsus olseni]|uniref:DNA independent RNA polymerase I transcription factor n=3 Tax=Perkinsus olseni TaxID=32597 RepID=A0A7J6NLF2_PEROL|nr:DNA independent RNA polymerase I transcription factor [Perkinsus olseni]